MIYLHAAWVAEIFMHDTRQIQARNCFESSPKQSHSGLGYIILIKLDTTQC